MKHEIRIGRPIYCIVGDSIIPEKIGFIGAESFIVESINDFTLFCNSEYFYSEENERWFFTLTDARKALAKQKFVSVEKVVRREFNHSEWWEVEA